MLSGLNRNGSADAELDAMMRSATERLGADAALIAVCDGQGGEPRVHASWGAPLGLEVVTALEGRGAIGRSIRNGTAVAKRVAPVSLDGGGLCVTDVFAAPIRCPDGTEGALCLGFDGEPDDPGEVLSEVSSYAAQATQALDNQDAFTGLLERFEAAPQAA